MIMKLQEYFDQHKDHNLSDIQKMDIYRSVMEKNMKKSFQRKRSLLHVKSFVYSSFLLFFLIGFYGMYIFQQPTNEDTDGYMFSRLSNTNVAQADFIAKIVDFDGSFYVEQWGKVIQTSNIKNGDVITLRQDAQIVFHIDNETKAKIVWPAKFVINKKWNNNYKIALLYWEYVEMSSLQKVNKYNVELSVDDLLVSQWENKKPINYQLVRQGDSHVIKNNWAKLIVSSDDKKSTTNVENNQVLAIEGNDISLFDSFEKFAKAVKDKDLSQTFTYTDIEKTPSTETISDGSEEIQEDVLTVLDEEEILNIKDQEVPTDISIPFDEGWQQIITTPEQIETIDTQLSKKSLQNNIDDLVEAYQTSDYSSFTKNFEELSQRISTITRWFGYKYSLPKGTEQEKINSLITNIETLANDIEKEYLLPPKYIESLRSIIPLISPLKDKPFEDITE